MLALNKDELRVLMDKLEEVKGYDFVEIVEPRYLSAYNHKEMKRDSFIYYDEVGKWQLMSESEIRVPSYSEAIVKSKPIEYKAFELTDREYGRDLANIIKRELKCEALYDNTSKVIIIKLRGGDRILPMRSTILFKLDRHFNLSNEFIIVNSKEFKARFRSCRGTADDVYELKPQRNKALKINKVDLESLHKVAKVLNYEVDHVVDYVYNTERKILAYINGLPVRISEGDCLIEDTDGNYTVISSIDYSRYYNLPINKMGENLFNTRY